MIIEYIHPIIKEIGVQNRTAMIVLPGGGYDSISEREGEPVAAYFFGRGFQTFVLNYATGQGSYRKAIEQLDDCISMIRRNCKEWDIDPNKVVLCGFSAGGHLALSHTVECSHNMANALLLGYPVVTTRKEYSHKQSILNCLADSNISEELLSMENRINHVEGFPPVFAWGCSDDKDVPINNLLLLGESLSNRSIRYEMHIFPEGGHGLSLGTDSSARIPSQINPKYEKWIEFAESFLSEYI